MMEYVIIAILVIAAIFIALYIMRKRHKTEILRLEDLKLKIEHKPILEELSKVKGLNMNGQTEALFERWRQIWTEVMDKQIPDINLKLEGANEAADRFKFSKATSLETAAENEIGRCEGQMNQILNELDELIGSEEQNRREMDVLQEQYRLSRKTLLAHRHSFGNAADPIEKRLEEFVPLFEQYEEMTANGNYLQAREVVQALSKDADEIFPLIHEVPVLLSEIQSKIPASVHELRSGQREMEMKSYFLAHLGMDSQLNEIEDELTNLKYDIAELDTAAIKKQVDSIKNRIETFYDLLEREVNAKHFVDSQMEETERKLESVAQKTRETADEYAVVRQSYRIPEKEADTPRECRLRMEHLQERFGLLLDRYSEDQSAYSNLEEELVSVQGELAEIDEIQTAFAAFMKNLRIDETTARKKVETLKQVLVSTDRMLHKANIPGIPAEMDVRLEESEEQLFVALQRLKEVPLNMEKAESDVAKAEASITDTHQKAEEMVENVLLIERIIQYGNRFRKADPKLNARLLEAEESFRQLRYAKALEEAATAVESYEPGAMKRIEEMAKEDLARI